MQRLDFAGLGSAWLSSRPGSARLGSARLRSALGPAWLDSARGSDLLGSAQLGFWLLAQLGSAFFWRSWTMVLLRFISKGFALIWDAQMSLFLRKHDTLDLLWTHKCQDSSGKTALWVSKKYACRDPLWTGTSKVNIPQAKRYFGHPNVIRPRENDTSAPLPP